jgi:hypothetical protein
MRNAKPPEAKVTGGEPDVSSDFDALIKQNVQPETPTRTSIDGVVIGTIVGLTDHGATPLVTYPGQPGTVALPARTTVDLHGPHVGREALLMFENGDPRRPVVIGCVRNTATPFEQPGLMEVDADGERMVLSANQGLVLRCGKASITLSPDGKIVVRGTQLVSHASGLNRIKGASVQVN